MKQKTLLGLALACLLGAFIVATLIYNVEREVPDGMVPAVDRAALVRMHSPALGRNLDYLVALPADYETAKDRFYPVLYLLHGRGD